MRDPRDGVCVGVGVPPTQAFCLGGMGAFLPGTELRGPEAFVAVELEDVGGVLEVVSLVCEKVPRTEVRG